VNRQECSPGNGQSRRRKARARKLHRERRRQHARHTGALLPLLADALRHAAEIYNQAAVEKVHVDGPQSEGTYATLNLTISHSGFRFEDAGEGYVRVWEVSPDTLQEHATLKPLVDRTGELRGWDELAAASCGQKVERTVDSLSEAYLMSMVRRRLLD